MQKLVVVGNGMAGVACVEQILRHAPKFQITIFGDETHVNYNRILLSSVLAGEKSADDIVLNGLDWYEKNGIELRLGVRIIDVDPVAKTITGDDGSVTSYDKLLLATGSMPLIPSIQDVMKDGVFVFRNLDDTRQLLERARPGLKAVVIGGGLLGLEAARGLQVQGCDVTVVHLMETLMERQLDPTGGSYLANKMNQMGITVLLGLSTTKVLGNGHVEGVEFKGGGSIAADLVVIAAGIRPNITLGEKAGLEIKRGIVVNDYMETSNPDIFAVGECVQHRGICYGLVAPLIEQGKVLAATITGNKGPTYEGTVLGTKLKIMGVDVFSAGEINDKVDGSEVIRYEDPSLGIYKKLTLKNNKLSGVILVGETRDSHNYMEWLRSQNDLSTMRRQLLFPDSSADTGLDVAQMSDSETICGCMGVSKGAIIQAIHKQGVCTMAQLKEHTRASTGCGSCAGLCQSLLKAVVPDFQEEAKRTI
ncbi:MAG TPA: FAD-dependent oxidoreductase, partial [Terriglobales bacterium]